MPRALPHEKLIVYQKAASLYEPIRRLVADLRPPHVHLGEQALRSASSIPLNIAEGACEFSRGDKARFYRMALRSAGETCAAIDLMRRSGLAKAEQSQEIMNQLGEIVAILTALTKPTAR
jgi:four helix bundle protein